MKQRIQKIFSAVLSDMNVSNVLPDVEISDKSEHGDYTTNVAMVAAKYLKKNPMAIADDIKKTFEEWIASGERKKADPVLDGIDHIEIAPPGFINVFLKNDTLVSNLNKSSDWASIMNSSRVNSGSSNSAESSETTGETGHNIKTIMVEYAHPNTHKSFHVGHLRNITTGEAVVRLLEKAGNTVIRVNYQGDVGLHIAKALYGILQMPNLPAGEAGAQSQMLNKTSIKEKIKLLSEAYVAGNKAYEDGGEAKEKIIEINKQIYAKDPSIFPLYKQTRDWSLEYFETIYKRVGSHFDRFYFESETYAVGKHIVEENIGSGIFEKSDGAVIFPGEKFKLHNRVFITSEGNPTYEGKDIGLAKLQFDEYHPDQIIHVVASEQTEYFRVIFEALSQILPETKEKEHHLVYGWVRLKTGKMSSRSGNVVLGQWLLDEVKKSMQEILTKGDRGYDKEEQDDIAEKAAVAAVKYAFLKVSTPQEIAFDIKESVNLNGDSGPYLLYTYARCKSVMGKNTDRKQRTENREQILNAEEHNLARLLFYFPEIVADAGMRFAPNTLCSYLFNLSQTFNLLYAKHEILGNNLRLMLTEKTAETLNEGLRLLGIETVERM